MENNSHLEMGEANSGFLCWSSKFSEPSIHSDILPMWTCNLNNAAYFLLISPTYIKYSSKSATTLWNGPILFLPLLFHNPLV